MGCDDDNSVGPTPKNYMAGGTLPPPPPPISQREHILLQAIEATTKARNNSYGPPTQDFQRIASMATSLGFSFDGKSLKGHHVSMFMILMKLSRATWSPEDDDHWVDIAGYAGCGSECVNEDTDS